MACSKSELNVLSCLCFKIDSNSVVANPEAGGLELKLEQYIRPGITELLFSLVSAVSLTCNLIPVVGELELGVEL